MGMLMHMTMLEEQKKREEAELALETEKTAEKPVPAPPAEEEPVEKEPLKKPVKKPVRKAPVRRGRK